MAAYRTSPSQPEKSAGPWTMPPMAQAPAAIASPTATVARDSTSEATYLAVITGKRRGAKVNVVRAVRWVHSDVMASSPINGVTKATMVATPAL